MQITLLEDPKPVFSREDMRCIDCDVLVDGVPYRYTASAEDPEAHGRALYATLMLTPDKIGPYVEPVPHVPPENK